MMVPSCVLAVCVQGHSESLRGRMKVPRGKNVYFLNLVQSVSVAVGGDTDATRFRVRQRRGLICVN